MTGVHGKRGSGQPRPAVSVTQRLNASLHAAPHAVRTALRTDCPGRHSPRPGGEANSHLSPPHTAGTNLPWEEEEAVGYRGPSSSATQVPQLGLPGEPLQLPGHQLHLTSQQLGTSLVVQWLRLCTPNAGGPGSIPGGGTRSYMLQLRVHQPQQRMTIPRAVTKTWCN